MKRHLSLALTSLLLLSTINLSACTNSTSTQTRDENVLRIASWDEYIDMGGEDSYYSADSRPLYEEFEDWYKATYGKTIKVEYVALQDNETMYSKIKMGDTYDLLCPSEYMIMKLATQKKIPFFKKYPRDPGSAITHFIAWLLAVIAASPLIVKAWDSSSLAAMAMMMPTTMFVVNASPKTSVPTRIAVIGSNTPKTDAFVAPIFRVDKANVAVETTVGRRANPIKFSQSIPLSMPVVMSESELKIFIKKTSAPAQRA